MQCELRVATQSEQRLKTHEHEQTGWADTAYVLCTGGRRGQHCDTTTCDSEFPRRLVLAALSGRCSCIEHAICVVE